MDHRASRVKTATARLSLVKHSLPEIDSSLPANQWHLSEAGLLRCKPLAERLVDYRPDVIVSSREPKAVETAQIVAAILSKHVETAANLHEHDRSNVGFLDVEQFEAAVAGFFANPDQLVFGKETASQAHHRFELAIAGVLEKHPSQNVVVVAHGAVISLFVARAAGLDAFRLSQRLGLPSFVVLSLPELRLLTILEQIDLS